MVDELTSKQVKRVNELLGIKIKSSVRDLKGR